MFFNILDEPRQILLKEIVEQQPVAESYLAGGTALALMLGHRQSIDFDWFTPQLFDPSDVAKNLGSFGKVEIAETSKGTFHGWVNDLQVTWLHYPNPILDEMVMDDALPGFKLASLLDIALMKWTAISDRGSMKDFIDLFFICHEGITLPKLISLFPKKFPNANINYYHMIKSLVFFDDAENEAPPVMLTPIEWSDIKEFFRLKQKELIKTELFLPFSE